MFIKVCFLPSYRAFANSCPLQTDKFLFPLIQSATLFKQVWIVLWKTGPINTMYGLPPQGPMRCRYTPCINCHIAHRSWQHFKMKYLWRYGRELCYTLELIHTLHARNDKENCVGFHNSVFSRRSENVFRFREFSRTSRKVYNQL